MKTRRFASIAAGLTALAATAAPLASATSAAAAPTKTLQSPLSVWAQPGAGPIDGLGSFLAVAAEPAATGAQAAPAYLLGQTYSFENHSPGGIVGLTTDTKGRSALFAVVSASGEVVATATPFNWKAGRIYLPIVLATGDGKASGWVYDYTAATWTPIGSFNVPVAWGRAALTSMTWTAWTGAAQDACDKYPAVDVYRYPTLGLKIGGASTVANPVAHAALPGDCAATVTVGPEPWAHSHLGTAVT